MPFAKGHKLSTGRPPGAKSIKTEQWEMIGQYLTREGADTYLASLKKLYNDEKYAEFMERFEKILEYFKPKLARKEITGEDGGPVETNLTIEFINKSPERIDRV